ncbi:hypothetical protein F4781DRAFT_185637 [Annulohypoxylon bovei var. microspora]|nr:hypothetical protein F4781DRAFT_185637 [Annulohypoxylon bovei var. microspora]
MASPLLPFVTLRLLDVPMHSTKRDIAALFELEDLKQILFISLAEAVLPSFPPSQVATVTFASSSRTLDKLLRGGFIPDKQNSSHKISLGDDFYGLTPLNDPVEPKDCADLIAVTGLGGHAFVSWQNAKGQMWLRDYLPADVPNLRVFTYGFPSTLWKTTSTATLSDHTHHFISQLRNCTSIGRVGRVSFYFNHDSMNPLTG